MIEVSFDTNSKLYNIVDEAGNILYSSQRELTRYGDYAVYDYHSYPFNYGEYFLYINGKLETVKCKNNIREKAGNSISLKRDNGNYDLYAETKKGLKLIKTDLPIIGLEILKDKILTFNINDKCSAYSLETEKFLFEDYDFNNISFLIQDYLHSETKASLLFNDALFLKNDKTNECNIFKDGKLIFPQNLLKSEISFYNENVFYLVCTDLQKQRFIFNFKTLKIIMFLNNELILPIFNKNYFVLYKEQDMNSSRNCVINSELYDENVTFIMKFESLSKIGVYVFISSQHKLVIYRDSFDNILRTHDSSLNLTPNIWYSDNYIDSSNPRPIVFHIPKEDKLKDFFFYATENNNGYLCNKTTLEILTKDLNDYCKETDFNNGFLVFNKKTLKYETYTNGYDDVEVINPITKEINKKTELVFRQREIGHFSTIEGCDILDNCLLTKDELIELGNKTASASGKKSDLNSFMKKIYSTQIITKDEFEEIKKNCYYIPWKNQTLKKDMSVLIKKLSKTQLKEFAKDKNILEAKIFSIWSE